MNRVMYMHETTFRYLKEHPDVFKAKQQVMTSGSEFGFYGIDIKFDNKLKPTINEQKGRWIFPKERFVTYEHSDEGWCRYFKIGHEGRGLILGEVLGVDKDFFQTKPMKRSRAFDPKGMRY